MMALEKQTPGESVGRGPSHLSTTAAPAFDRGIKIQTFAATLVVLLAAMIETSELSAKIVSVQSFGAAGDGITDDSNAIQAAINSCNAGDTVRFPAGNYYVSHTLSIHSNCTYTGQTGAIISGYTGTGPSGWTLFRSVDTNAANIVISGLTFNGGGISFGDTMGTATIQLTNNTFENILNSSSSWGEQQFAIYSGNVLLSGSIDHNTFLHLAAPGEMDKYWYNGGKEGMQIYAASDLTISNNTFDYISGDAIQMSYPGDGVCRGQLCVPHPNIQIINNTITRNHRNPIEIQMWYMRNPVLSGNRIHAMYKATGFGISFAVTAVPTNGADERNATGAILQNNIVDSTDYIGAQYQEGSCYELMGTNTVFENNICINGLQSNGIGIYGTAVAVDGYDDIISYNIFCGPWPSGWLNYEPPYPNKLGHPAIVMDNQITVGSCAIRQQPITHQAPQSRYR